MVELMVVIIIMAILGLAIIPSLMGSSDKAKYSRDDPGYRPYPA